MQLCNAKKYMDEIVNNNYCDSYAVSVFANGEISRIMSDGIDADTYFDVASSGKVLVTSTLVLITVGKGKLKLSDTLDMFFNDVPSDKKNITVQQLLTHTSGILRTELADNSAEIGHDGVAAQILNEPLAFAPGSDYTYSCHGFILLGFILEKVWGKTLSEIFEEKLKNPLGMTRATFNLPTGEQNRVISHRRECDGDFPGDDENLYIMRECAGSGGQFYSIADIEKLLTAILNKSPLLYPKEIFDLAEKDYTPNYSNGRGLGYWYVDERISPNNPLLSEGSFGHWGSTGTCFYIDRKKNLFYILLTNMRRGSTLNHELNYTEYCEIFEKTKYGLCTNIVKDIDNNK